MGLIEVHDRDWPVLLIRPPDTRVSEEDLDSFLTENLLYLKMRAEPFCYVLDLRNSGGLTATQRKRLSAAFGVSERELPGMCRGTAMVFDSTFLRGVLTAVLWLKKPAYPTKVFGDQDSATLWAAARTQSGSVETAGLDVSARAVPEPLGPVGVSSTPPGLSDFGMSAREEKSISGDSLRKEASRIHEALMMEDPGRLDPDSADALSRALMAIARKPWSDEIDLLQTRRHIEDMWVESGGAVSCNMNGTETWTAVESSDVLSVLTKYMDGAA
jgi:hypothetical protein